MTELKRGVVVRWDIKFYLFLSVYQSVSISKQPAHRLLRLKYTARHYPLNPLFNIQLMPPGLSCLIEDENEDKWRGELQE